MAELTFQLKPAPPFRLDMTAWALRRRQENQIDLWDGRFYRRLFFVTQVPILVSVRQIGPVDKPRLEITAVSKQSMGKHKDALAAVLERTLGLRTDLRLFYELAAPHPKIGALVRRFVGFRPPRFPTVFEALANAIACQQLSLTVGIILLNRLARAHERGSATGFQTPLAFPSPEQVAKADPEQLRALGLSRQKARALI
ncbi:MAG: DNA-3-methyladenine glycosylase family protein, partial [Candidatus Binataceae bacterium]